MDIYICIYHSNIYIFLLQIQQGHFYLHMLAQTRCSWKSDPSSANPGLGFPKSADQVLCSLTEFVHKPNLVQNIQDLITLRSLRSSTYLPRPEFVKIFSTCVLSLRSSWIIVGMTGVEFIGAMIWIDWFRDQIWIHWCHNQIWNHLDSMTRFEY